jgi:hypothetical protein
MFVGFEQAADECRFAASLTRTGGDVLTRVVENFGHRCVQRPAELVGTPAQVE